MDIESKVSEHETEIVLLKERSLNDEKRLDGIAESLKKHLDEAGARTSRILFTIVGAFISIALGMVIKHILSK